MQTLQNNLVRATDRIVRLIDSGESSLNAIVKVASAESLLPDQVERLCQLYNRASSLSQRLSGGPLGEKLASPDVVDPRNVMHEMSLRGRKQAGIPLPASERVLETSRLSLMRQPIEPAPAVSVKQAAAPELLVSDRQAGLHHGVSGISLVNLRQEISRKIAELNDAGEQLLAYAELKTNLAVTGGRKIAGMHNGPEMTAQARYWVSENMADQLPVFDAVMVPTDSRLFTEKYAAFGQEIPNRWCDGVLGDRGVVQAFTAMIDAVETVRREVPKLAAKIAALREEDYLIAQNSRGGRVVNTGFLVGDVSRRDLDLQHIAKVANFVETYAASLLAGGANGSKSPNPRALTGVDRFKLMLQHPQHEVQLGAVRSRRALQELLTDDPVIAATPKDDAVAAFNEISAYSPKITENPAALRAVLRQYLQNNSSSFDLAQLRNLERQGRPSV